MPFGRRGGFMLSVAGGVFTLEFAEQYGEHHREYNEADETDDKNLISPDQGW